MGIFSDIFGMYSIDKDGFVTDGASQILPTSSGAQVSASSSLMWSAFFAAGRNIAEDLAKLPLKVRKQKKPFGSDLQQDHPVYKLLHREPNIHMTSMVFRETLLHHSIVWGDGLAEIKRDGAGRPQSLDLIHPGSLIKMTQKGNTPAMYIIRTNNDGVMGEDHIPARDMIHVHGLGANGFRGYALYVLAKEATGLALETEKFGASFFRNGTHVSGALSIQGRLHKDTRTALKEEWAEKQGGQNQLSPAILQDGTQWVQFGIPPDSAQFLETRQFQILEACRIFRIPPHKIQYMEAQPLGNIEHQGIEYVGDTLHPHAERFEQEADRKLFTDKEKDDGFFVKHNFDALLRGDSAARMAVEKDKIYTGQWTINQARELNDENPIGPDGDIRFIPTGLQTLENAIAGPQNQPIQDKAELENEEVVENDKAPNDPDTPPDNNDIKPPEDKGKALDSLMDSFSPLIKEAVDRINYREDNAKARGKELDEGFMVKQSEYMFKALTPIALRLASLTGSDDVAARHRVKLAVDQYYSGDRDLALVDTIIIEGIYKNELQ